MREASLKTVFDDLKGPNGLFVAISGGIGSGKSAVAEMVRAAGHEVLHSDAIAADLIANHPEIRREIGEALGAEALNEVGSLNKAATAALVFGPDKQHEKRLRKLNSVVHPYVVQEIAERLQALYADGKRCVFNETAIVFEAGLEDLYDYVLVVDAPEDIRIQRLIKTRSMTAEQIQQRMATQLHSEEIRRRADFVIENSNSLDELKAALNKILLILPHLPPKRGAEVDE